MARYKKIAFVTDLHISSVIPAKRLDDFTETAFQKFWEILMWCRDNQAVLTVGGDWFNNPVQPDFIKIRLKDMIRVSKVIVLGITGNHDLLYYSEDSMNKVSLGLLDVPGAVNIVSSENPVQIGDWLIYAHKFGSRELPEVKQQKSIILSHAFYAMHEDDKLYLSRDEVAKSKAWAVCMGHDHNMYDIREVEGTYVVRPGAMTRGTSHTENQVRKPSFASINMETGAIEYIALKTAKPFDEVFRRDYDVKKKPELVSFDQIQRFIKELKDTKVQTNPYDILMNMQLRPEVFNNSSEYLRKVGLFNNVA